MIKKITFLIVVLTLMFGLTTTVLADTKKTTPKKGLGAAMGNLDSSTAGSDLPKNLETTLSSVIKGALSLIGTIFLILTIYAGILWMTAQGNDDQVTKAIGIIKASVIGLFITMSAYAITYFITTRFTGS